MAAELMCPHCGWKYDPEAVPMTTRAPFELVPAHEEQPPAENGIIFVCPGTEQHPRNPESDRRPLWKDLPAGA